MSVWSRDGRAREIHLEEDVYVVVGDSGESSTSLSEWPPVGSAGPAPREGVLGPLSGILGSIGPELWQAKREGPTVTLLSRCAHYSSATALLWGADCLEHVTQQLLAEDGEVTQALVLARKYAAERVFQAEQAHALAAQLDKRLGRLRASGVGHLVGQVFGHALEGDILGWRQADRLNAAERSSGPGRIGAEEIQAREADVLHAAKALCGADPLLAAREAAHFARKAAARNDDVHLGLHRADIHPGAAQSEATWQAQKLAGYLDPEQTPVGEASADVQPNAGVQAS